MNQRRSPIICTVVALVAALALGACEPLPDVPIGFVPPPPGAALSVPTTTVARGSTFEVAATGCADDLQYVEVRLVVDVDGQARSAAVTSAWEGSAEIEVPGWASSGSARVEASCLEPNMSHASDGADIVRFDYQPVAVTVAGAPAQVPSGITVPDVVSDGVLQVSGTDCTGRVLISVSRGRSLVASAARFHYGRTLVQAEPDGSWSAAVPLLYSVATFTDPVAPGPMSVFVVCEGQWYPGETFDVVSSRPALQFVGVDPSLLYLSQCPPENTVGILGLVQMPGDVVDVVAANVPGKGYGENFYDVALPAGATGVTWWAGCAGQFNPVFSYASASWSA